MASCVTLKIVSYAEAAAAIQSIRYTVFQIEQGVDPAIEFDGQDGTAKHIVAYWDGNPIGAARIRFLSKQMAKIERVAVLSAYRGKGVGTQVMEAAIAWLGTQNFFEVKVNAQVHAKAFYQKLGFAQQGEEFDEAGIPHVEMRKLIE
jgi:predicted GNAT family N-acyltransferase